MLHLKVFFYLLLSCHPAFKNSGQLFRLELSSFLEAGSQMLCRTHQQGFYMPPGCFRESHRLLSHCPCRGHPPAPPLHRCLLHHGPVPHSTASPHLTSLPLVPSPLLHCMPTWPGKLRPCSAALFHPLWQGQASKVKKRGGSGSWTGALKLQLSPLQAASWTTLDFTGKCSDKMWSGCIYGIRIFGPNFETRIPGRI